MGRYDGAVCRRPDNGCRHLTSESIHYRRHFRAAIEIQGKLRTTWATTGRPRTAVNIPFLQRIWKEAESDSIPPRKPIQCVTTRETNARTGFYRVLPCFIPSAENKWNGHPTLEPHLHFHRIRRIKTFFCVYQVLLVYVLSDSENDRIKYRTVLKSHLI